MTEQEAASQTTVVARLEAELSEMKALLRHALDDIWEESNDWQERAHQVLGDDRRSRYQAAQVQINNLCQQRNEAHHKLLSANAQLTDLKADYERLRKAAVDAVNAYGDDSPERAQLRSRTMEALMVALHTLGRLDRVPPLGTTVRYEETGDVVTVIEYREAQVVAKDQRGYEFRIDPNDFAAGKLSRVTDYTQDPLPAIQEVEDRRR